METYIIAILITDLILGVIPAKIAEKKGKDFWKWYLYGISLFFFAMIHAIVLPEQSEQAKKLNFIDVYTTNEIKHLDIDCPIEVTGYKIKISEDKSQLICVIDFFNLSEKIVSAVEVNLTCYNSFNEKISNPYGNEITSLIQDQYGKCKEHFGTDTSINLSNYLDTRMVDITVRKVLFSDNTIWERADNNSYYINNKNLMDNELLATLKNVEGEDAKYYLSMTKDTWTCVCGRINNLEDKFCIKCNRNKEYMLKNYADSNSLEKRVDEIKQQEKNKQDHMKLEKIRKNKDNKKKIIVAISAILIISMTIFGTEYIKQVKDCRAKINVYIEEADDLAKYGYYDSAKYKLEEIYDNFYMNRPLMGHINKKIQAKIKQYEEKAKNKL
ncbi:hypothetical protein [Clostridium tetani]|uniref:hypothetical protein n=1 Tax=Clostridium tetani TaxID=1513 RepID=UPI00100BC967|nr:hypothetical protein [Clostridium tetani]RXM59330.1 hypothetical protein DP133_00130 [Clostridium tetani]